MFLSHTFKLCFVHIPRSGGSWLTYKIRDLDKTNKGKGHEVLLINDVHPKYVQIGRHTTLERIYEVSDANLDSYFKFCVSRHPYTRFQSAWDYLSNTMETARRQKLKDWYDMMSWIEDGARKQHTNLQTDWYDKRFDSIFKFENIEKVNLKKFAPLMVNFSKRSNPIVKTTNHSELKDDLKERIYKHYIKDFQMFDYQP